MYDPTDLRDPSQENQDNEEIQANLMFARSE